MGRMYKVVVKKRFGFKTVQTYAEDIDEAIDKVIRCEKYKVDVVQTHNLYKEK